MARKMGCETVVKIAASAVTPLAWNAEETFARICEGMTALRLHEASDELPEAWFASCFTRLDIEKYFDEIQPVPKLRNDYTYFEKLAIAGAWKAVKDASIDPSSQKVLFVLSSTKGNVELLEHSRFDATRGAEPKNQHVCLARSARKIAEFFGNRQTPLVVSNACTSGVCAQIAAHRALMSHRYDYVVVIGAEVQSRFIVSGFQSFKALSEENCRPFDNRRKGLNVGEAAACMVLTLRKTDGLKEGDWILCAGSIHNDANHISGPSRTGEGLYRCLKDITENADLSDTAFVNVHGTATPYNDEMESIALHRAKLDNIPVNGLKGYFGHTMGAAGILETIISMLAVEKGIVAGTRGYETNGVSFPLQVSSQNRPTRKKSFLKVLSGFGGCNAALRFHLYSGKTEGKTSLSLPQKNMATFRKTRQVRITPGHVWINGKTCCVRAGNAAFLTALYRQNGINYPKFFKMDPLCRLGFIASELLLEGESDRFCPREDTAVILFNKNSSFFSDFSYQKTIADKDNYFPSPSVFVYTLPNIVTGEIAIRNKFFGETSFYLLENPDEEQMNAVVEDCFRYSGARRVLGGWVDYLDENDFSADMFLAEAAPKSEPGPQPTQLEK